MTTQEPLFPIAGPPPPTRRVSVRGVAYTRVNHQRRRVLCHDCTDAIHQLGVALAPFPQPASWRRVAPGEPTLDLCYAHRSQRVEQEGDAHDR